MSVNQVKDDVTKLVEDILEKKALAGIEADLEAALKSAEKAVVELADKLTAAEVTLSEGASVVEGLEAAKVELEAEVAAKSEKIASLEAEVAGLLQRAESAEKTLDDMSKDKQETARMGELEGLKVARSGEARAKQVQLVRDMSEEEYVSYKEEMVAIREDLLQTVSSEVAAPSEGEDETSEVVAVQTPPADVEGALEETASVVPNAVSSDMYGSKWKNFASNFSKYLEETRSEAAGQKKR